MRWRARWIWWFPGGEPPVDPWTAERTSRRDAWVMLRRTFASPAGAASLRVTCDGRYILWVNGRRVGHGPVRSEPAHLTFDHYEVPLRDGENVVAVLARHYGRSTTTFKLAPVAGWALGCGGFALDADVAAMRTGAGWRAREAPAVAVAPAPLAAELPALDLDEGPPPTEWLDARGWPDGWLEPGFDDAGWEDACVLIPRGHAFPHPEPPSEPFALLSERPIAALGERRVEPNAIRGRGAVAARPDLEPRPALLAGGSWRPVDEAPPARLGAGEGVTFAFDGIVHGHPLVRASAAPGTVIDLACGEDLAPDGRPVIEPRNWVARHTAGGGALDWETFEPVGMRYLSLAVRAGSLDGVRVAVVERLYPREPGAVFRCSDPGLERVWQAGVRTLDLCSADAYLDCPGREQRAWISDAYLHSLVSSVCNADTRLMRHNLRLHAQGARADGLLPMVAAGDFTDRVETIPDGSLHWVRALARVWERTGDRALAEELLPVALRVLNAFERWRGTDGLLHDVPGWVFLDWAQLGRGQSIAVLDALYALALDDAASVADACNDLGTARALRARSTATRRAFERYWDAGRGVYVDATGSRRVSQHTNALAILCGAAQPERWRGLLDAILDPGRLVRTRTPGDPGTFAERLGSNLLPPEGFDDETGVVLAQPWFAHFLHEALATAGRHEALVGSIRRWVPLLERGDGCFGEHWDAEPGLASRAHAWSAAPAYDLVAHVAGVRPAAPGWSAVGVRPNLGGLDRVEVCIPTPRGDVRVRAEAGSEPEVDLPPGVTLRQR